MRAFAESDVRDVADAHHLENVVSLCISCHREADAGLLSRAYLRMVAGVDAGR